MKITERRIVEQYWYEDTYTKRGWDSHGWRFDDGGYLQHRENWTVVEVIREDKYGQPILGIAEKETEI